MTSIAIIVTPYFNAMTTFAFLDAFRVTNYLCNEKLFDWSLYSTTGGLVTASNRLTVETESLSDRDARSAGIVVVSASWEADKYARDNTLLNTIKLCARNGALMCGLDTGTIILAAAGLLNRRLATLHYEHIDTFQESYPNVMASEQIYTIDPKTCTSAGGVVSLDLALRIIESLHGRDVATASGKYLLYGVPHPETERQSVINYIRDLQHIPPELRMAIDIMEQHLEDPVTIEAIAAAVNISPRQLTRLFRRHTKQSSVQYYRNARLDRARSLVTQTNMPLVEIATACGFTSSSYFSRIYRDRFHVTAGQDRRLGRVPFEFRPWPMHSRHRQ